LLALCAGSCAKQPATAVDRVAVVRFDNLTGDASFDWIAPVASAILSSEWSGPARTIAMPAASVREGYLAGATRFARGYFEQRKGKLQFHVLMEDAARHKNIAEEVSTGDPLTAMNAIARRIQPASNVFSTTNSEAVEAWGRGDFERALTLDPDFSAAWLSWMESLVAKGDPQRAAEIGSRALMRPGLRSLGGRARIQLAVATINHDDDARIAALADLSHLTPFDTAALRTLAEAQFAGRRFKEAEQSYKELLRLDPTDVTSMNTLGYVQAVSGEVDQARTSFENYGRQPGQNINALDSLGEAMFLNGKFAEAEKAFLEGYEKSPSFLDNGDLWKAAHARWLGGDLRGAEELLARYFEARSRVNDPLVTWRRANWLYETGRDDEAVGLAKQNAASAPAPEATLFAQQLAAWKDPQAAIRSQDLEKLKQLYERANPVSDGLERTIYATGLLDAGREEEARMLVGLWPLPQIGTSPLESLTFPLFLNLKAKLK
jgi:tetratricopeptide (TPR) repeat protein